MSTPPSSFPEHMAFAELARPENRGTRRALERIVRQVGTILGINPPPEEQHTASVLSFFRATNAALAESETTAAASEARMLTSEFMDLCDWLEGTALHRPILVFLREWLDWHVQEARYESCGSAAELWRMMRENEKKPTWKTLSTFERLLRHVEAEIGHTRTDELKSLLGAMMEKMPEIGRSGADGEQVVFGNEMLYRTRVLADRLDESKAADDSWAA